MGKEPGKRKPRCPTCRTVSVALYRRRGTAATFVRIPDWGYCDEHGPFHVAPARPATPAAFSAGAIKCRSCGGVVDPTSWPNCVHCGYSLVAAARAQLRRDAPRKDE